MIVNRKIEEAMMTIDTHRAIQGLYELRDTRMSYEDSEVIVDFIENAH